MTRKLLAASIACFVLSLALSIGFNNLVQDPASLVNPLEWSLDVIPDSPDVLAYRQQALVVKWATAYGLRASIGVGGIAVILGAVPRLRRSQ